MQEVITKTVKEVTKECRNLYTVVIMNNQNAWCTFNFSHVHISFHQILYISI